MHLLGLFALRMHVTVGSGMNFTTDGNSREGGNPYENAKDIELQNHFLLLLIYWLPSARQN